MQKRRAVTLASAIAITLTTTPVFSQDTAPKDDKKTEEVAAKQAKPKKPKPKGGPKFAPGWNTRLNLFGQAYVGNIDFENGRNADRDRSEIGTETFGWATGAFGLSYAWKTESLGLLQAGAEGGVSADDWLDDDPIDEFSIFIRGPKFGNLYFGEQDGAADILKPKRAGRVGVAVGQGAFTGALNWYANMPLQGGIDRPDFDWGNGVPSGTIRAFGRDTADAIKIGYISPKKNGFRAGASINLQNTYSEDLNSDQDSYDDLEFKDDQFELGLDWSGKADAKTDITAALTFSSSCNGLRPLGAPPFLDGQPACQDTTVAGVRIGHDADYGRVRGSIGVWHLDNKDTTATAPGMNDVAEDETLGFHLGNDLQKGKWIFGANFVLVLDATNARQNLSTNGGRNWAGSVGADYKLTKRLTLGGGVAYAENQYDEEAVEVGASVTYRWGTVINKNNPASKAFKTLF